MTDRWAQLPFKKRAGSVTGLVALSATMTGITASTAIPYFWQARSESQRRGSVDGARFLN